MQYSNSLMDDKSRALWLDLRRMWFRETTPTVAWHVGGITASALVWLGAWSLFGRLGCLWLVLAFFVLYFGGFIADLALGARNDIHTYLPALFVICPFFYAGVYGAILPFKAWDVIVYRSPLLPTILTGKNIARVQTGVENEALYTITMASGALVQIWRNDERIWGDNERKNSYKIGYGEKPWCLHSGPLGYVAGHIDWAIRDGARNYRIPA